MFLRLCEYPISWLTKKLLNVPILWTITTIERHKPLLNTFKSDYLKHSFKGIFVTNERMYNAVINIKFNDVPVWTLKTCQNVSTFIYIDLLFSKRNQKTNFFWETSCIHKYYILMRSKTTTKQNIYHLKYPIDK